jgi:phage gpG-like protein
MANLKDINELQKIVGGLALNTVQAIKLNNAAGNAMRRVVRANLKQQKNIDGSPFKPRKKVKFTTSKRQKVSATTKMFRHSSRSLNQEATASGVIVGYSYKAGKILKIHNIGGRVNFVRGSGKRVSYKMTQRNFIGWSSDMVEEVKNSVIDAYLKMQGVN